MSALYSTNWLRIVDRSNDSCQQRWYKIETLDYVKCISSVANRCSPHGGAFITFFKSLALIIELCYFRIYFWSPQIKIWSNSSNHKICYLFCCDSHQINPPPISIQHFIESIFYDFISCGTENNIFSSIQYKTSQIYHFYPNNFKGKFNLIFKF